MSTLDYKKSRSTTIIQIFEYLLKKHEYPYEYLLSLTYVDFIRLYNKEIGIDKQWNDIVKNITKNNKTDLIKYTINVPFKIFGN